LDSNINLEAITSKIIIMKNLNSIRIMLVDDHAVVRAGVRRLLEQDAKFTVVAEAESGERAYQIFGEHLPDVTIIDLSMPGIGGMETIKRIVARYPTAKILVLSMHENVAFASQALKAGAKGYVTKSGLANELANAIEWVVSGQTYLGTELSNKIALQLHNAEGDPMQALSAREFEIFRMLVDGVDLNKIAGTLNISLKTVANYQTTIKQKLGVSSPVEMVRLAIRCGLIES
jgi:two-component system invasion response regulator UvrY